MIEALRDTHRRTGATMVVVTDDLAVIEEVSERLVVLANGRVAFQGAPKDALADLRYVRPAVPAEPDDGLVVVEEAVAGATPGGPARRRAPDTVAEPAASADLEAERGEPRPASRRLVNTALTAAVFTLIIVLFLLVVPKGG